MTVAEVRAALGTVPAGTLVVVADGDDELEEFRPVGALLPGIYEPKTLSFQPYPALKTPANVRAVCLCAVL